MDKELTGLIGLPWEIGGRDKDGVDCGGLVMLASRVLFDTEIPNKWEYGENDNLEATKQVLSDLPSFADEITHPHDGDIAVYERRRSVHFGIIVAGRMLHIADGGRSRLSRIPKHCRFFRMKEVK